MITDEEGNTVPNPVPADAQYLGQTLTVTKSKDGVSCSSTISISFTGAPEIIPVPFNSISANNYNFGLIPRPYVISCVEGSIDLTYEDEFISLCNDVPRVVRAWTATDKFGNSSTVYQTFDVIANLACTIIGPSRIKRGVATEIRSNYLPNGLIPFTSQWTLVGQDWSIKQDILNPTKITLTPGLTATKAIVQFDLFDRLGCKTSCVKEFNAIRNSDLNSFQFNDDATYASYTIIQNNLLVKWDRTKFDFIRILDLAGRIRHFGSLKSIQDEEININISELEGGLFFVQLLSKEGVHTFKIYR